MTSNSIDAIDSRKYENIVLNIYGNLNNVIIWNFLSVTAALTVESSVILSVSGKYMLTNKNEIIPRILIIKFGSK